MNQGLSFVLPWSGCGGAPTVAPVLSGTTPVRRAAQTSPSGAGNVALGAAFAGAFGALASNAVATRGQRRRVVVARHSLFPTAGGDSERYIDIMVKTSDGETIPIEARPMDRVNVIKAEMELRIGVAKEDMKLFQTVEDGEKELPDLAVIGNNGIIQGAELRMEIRKAVGAEEVAPLEDGYIRVNFSSQMTGGRMRSWIVDAKVDSTVKEVKAAGLAKAKTIDDNLKGLEPDDMGLFYPRPPLEAPKTRPEKEQAKYRGATEVRMMKPQERLDERLDSFKAALKEQDVNDESPSVHLVHLFYYAGGMH